ncbi:MAG: cation diffusion facilitator family transporter [Firmicutes bacterium]|nr:cation diffusion facilitator family transporter [Bacillota bacterium]MCL5038374.1 cation diffusion facilitator family transporter [Bacillota bacterium]
MVPTVDEADRGKIRSAPHDSRMPQARTAAAALSVASNSLLVILKLIVGLLTGSVSIISEAIHSGLDLLAAIIAYISIRVAARPADETHRYGHGKVENVSGTVEAILIFIAALWIIFEAVHKLFYGGAVEALGLGLLVMAVSAGANFLISAHLFRVAKATDSIALEADALHLRTDVYTSLGVLAGLGLIQITGQHLLDPLVAIVVALMIIKAAYGMTKEAFLPLLDSSLSAEEETLVRSVLGRYENRFLEFHALRTRRAGAERHIDLHLVVPGNTHVDEVHDVCDRIEAEMRGLFPQASVLIHVEPESKRKG